MMYIHHIALWTNDPERLGEFYSGFFGCKLSDRYVNHKKQFVSYFLSFPDGAKIELMKRTDITSRINKEQIGLAHFAIGVGSETQVDELTRRLEQAGVVIDSYPRITGDGYYESVILDPDNNKIELTAYS